MNYKNLIRTLGREHLKWDKVDNTIWIHNGNVLFCPHTANLPSALKDVPKSFVSLEEIVTKHKAMPWDSCQFTGLTFVHGTRTVAAYLARKCDGSIYPVFLNKAYTDLLGKNPVALYATGDSTSPIYYVGQECSGYIYPLRIHADALDKVAQVVAALRGKAED